MPGNQASFFVRLLGDSKGAVGAISKTNNELLKQKGILGSVAAGATKLSKTMKRGTDRIQANAVTIAGGLFAAKKAFDGTIGVAADFESAILKISAVSGGATSEIEKLARSAGETTVFSATEAADALLLMAQAGLDSSESAKALEPNLNLAAAAQIGLAESTDLVVSNLTVFQKGAQDAGEFADVMAKTTFIANTNMQQLGAALEFAGPVASQVGISFRGLNAMIATMATQGIKGEKAGTQLRAALTNIIKPTAQSRKVLNDLGITMDDIKKSISDPIKLFKLLKPVANDTSAAVQVFGKRNLAVASAIKNAGDQLSEFNTQLQEVNGTVKEAAEKQISGFNGQIKLLKSAFQELVISGSKDGGLLGIFTEITKTVIHAIRGFQKMPTALKAAGIAITVLTPAVLALNAALGPIGLALAAIGAAAFVAAAGLGAKNKQIKIQNSLMGGFNDQLNKQLAASGSQEKALENQISKEMEMLATRKKQLAIVGDLTSGRKKANTLAMEEARLVSELPSEIKNSKDAYKLLGDEIKKRETDLDALKEKQAQFLKEGGDQGAKIRAEMEANAEAQGKAYEDALKKAADAAKKTANSAKSAWDALDMKGKVKAVIGAVQGALSQGAGVISAINTMVTQKFENEQIRMTSAFKASQEAQHAALLEKFEKGLITQEEFNEEKEAIDNEFAIKKEEFDRDIKIRQAKAARKAAAFQKGINIANAIAGGALAVIQALSGLPPPASFIMAGITAALAAAQVAIIAATPLPEVPSFQKGGIKTREGLALVAERNKPEAILPAELTALLMEAAKMRGAGGNVIIQNLSLPNVTNFDSFITNMKRFIETGGRIPQRAIA